MGLALRPPLQIFICFRLPSGVQFSPSHPLWGRGWAVRFTDKSNSARSGALHGCTGHWDEIWESTTCSARCSARRSQYVDFHLLRNLWDRGFRGACLLRCAVFCQLRAGVVAIGREKNPHGGCAGVYLLCISKRLRLPNDLIGGENCCRDSVPGRASCHNEKPAPRPMSLLRGAEPPRLRQLY